MTETTISALLLTLRTSLLATIIVAIPGILLAYMLARHTFPSKDIIATLVGLPLVMPPTAVGYLLLKTFSTHGILGQDTLGFDIGLQRDGNSVGSSDCQGHI